MSEVKFIPAPKGYAAGHYSKKKIGIGLGGEGAFLFITPRAGDDFDDDLRHTVHLMSQAPMLYDVLESILKNHECGAVVDKEIERALIVARGFK